VLFVLNDDNIFDLRARAFILFEIRISQSRFDGEV
jgi:hypothetical protein